MKQKTIELLKIMAFGLPIGHFSDQLHRISDKNESSTSYTITALIIACCIFYSSKMIVNRFFK